MDTRVFAPTLGISMYIFACSSTEGTPEKSGPDPVDGTEMATGGSGVDSAPDGSGGAETAPPPEVEPFPSAACQAKAGELLAQMTLDEKTAQMIMIQNPDPQIVQDVAPGAVFAGGGAQPGSGNRASDWAALVDSYIDAARQSRLSIPILYGIDAVHGQNKVTGAVVFPHNIGLGCSGDAALIEEVGSVTAREMAASGMTWTFSPNVSVSQDDRWGRVFESFSEDPEQAGIFSAAATRGLQGPMGLGTRAPSIVACAKHFAGDGQTTAGTSFKPGIVDRGDIVLSEEDLRRYGITPYLEPLAAGLGTVMVSDATWNGQSLTGSYRMITEILKGELGFEGFVTTDWNAATEGPGPGVAGAIAAGVDMLMHPADFEGARVQIAQQADPARIDDAVTRILQVKCQAGLFDYSRDESLLTEVGSAAHREVARRAVQQSLVVLKNEADALPLDAGSKIWLGGSGADNLDRQCGGWTITWQGQGSLTEGTTIRQALSAASAPTATMEEADVAVVVLSEPPYAEFFGDVESVATLSPEDLGLLSAAKSQGKTVIAVLFTGRPVVIEPYLGDADAWVAAWLPGTEGAGVTDVLFGAVSPSGKLSHSWPRDDSQVTINKGDPGYDPLFEYGHGLTY